MSESMRVGLRRCSSSPVRVRKKRLPRFSNVHMVMVTDDWLKLWYVCIFSLVNLESY